MDILKDILYGTQDSNSQVFDLYLPDGEADQAFDVLIYFHGGGLKAGDKSRGLYFEYLANAGVVVISANYRMYPDAKFPDFLEDAASVVNWAKEHLSSYKKVKRTFVGGSSAGAYMTAMLAFDPTYLGVYGIKTTDIDGYIIDSAQMTTHFNVLNERGINPKRILVDEAAPVYFLTENTTFPNALVVVADDDMPCRLEQNLMFLKTAEMLGCPEGKLQYRLMEGYKHCKYSGSEMFADILLQYMASIA